MVPSIADGSFVLLKKCKRINQLQAGNLIIFYHPNYGYMLKSVVSMDEQGNLWCRGHHQESISMRQIGAISLSQVVGRVILTIQPPLASGGNNDHPIA